MTLTRSRRKLLESLVPTPRAASPRMRGLVLEFLRDGDCEGIDHLLREEFEALGAQDPAQTAALFRETARSVQVFFAPQSPPTANPVMLTKRQRGVLEQFHG